MTSLPLATNPNWKGGRTIASNGYVLVKCPEHPNADVRGYVYEHRLIAEQVLGRYLLPTEIVHHKNGKKTDNKPDNLVVEQSQAWHKVEHRSTTDRKLPAEGNPIVVCGCGCGTVLPKFDRFNRPRKYATGHNRRGKLNYDPQEMVQCACGCGNALKRFDACGRTREYVNGHNGRKKV